MTKGKPYGGLIRKTSETRTGAMNSIYQMVSAQPGLIPQVTWAITHTRFWVDTIFVDKYSNYYYANLISIP